MTGEGDDFMMKDKGTTMRLTGKTAGYLVAGIGWATLAFGIGLDQAGLRFGAPLSTVGGWVIASGLALAVIAATERGFGALDRFFGEILARTRRAPPRVEPTFDALAEAPPALAAPQPRRAAEPAGRLAQEAAPRLVDQKAPSRRLEHEPRRMEQEMRRTEQEPAPRRPAPQPAPLAFAGYEMDDEDDDAAFAPRRAAPAPRAAEAAPRRAPSERPAFDRAAQDWLTQERLRSEHGRQDRPRRDDYAADYAPAPPARERLAPPARHVAEIDEGRDQGYRPDAYPIEAPQPVRAGRANEGHGPTHAQAHASAAAPRELPRAAPPAFAPPLTREEPTHAPRSFDEELDWAAQETRGFPQSDTRAAPAAPAARPAYHPAPAAPANLDLPRAAQDAPRAYHDAPRAEHEGQRAPQRQRSEAPRASVIEEGELAGHTYRVLADLTVEIDTVLGARVFDSMEAARNFVGAPTRAPRARSVA